MIDGPLSLCRDAKIMNCELMNICKGMLVTFGSTISVLAQRHV